MAEKNMVIVESPAKARTISKFLGAEYAVVSSMGHVVDLPPKKLGIDIEHDYAAQLVVIPGKKKLLTDLKKKAKEAKNIYFATDPDREGEAIGWNLKERMNLKDKQIYRVEFHEITKGAIQEAFGHPRTFQEDKIKAQQARRILDRLVGYFLSPLLWRKVTRGLSAGRVQSVALRLVVERERAIMSFVAQEYWSVDVALRKKQGQDQRVFEATLDKVDGKKIELATEEDARAVVDEVQGKDFVVGSIEKNIKNKNPLPPLITSSLQQEAFNKLKFSAVKTMYVAQQLYEGIELGQEGPVGLITYMRTDSVQVSAVAMAEVREYILARYGAPYLPETARVYKSKKSAQQAHEAIRPTSVARSPQEIQGFLTQEQLKLYEIIWKRFVSSQMTSSQMEITTVGIRCGRYDFKATGNRVVFDGFSSLYKNETDPSEENAQKNTLPELAVEEFLEAVNLLPEQHFTKPPARYSEGSLIKVLEEEGVGRPSTYAPTISTIIARDYVRREKGYLAATDLGMKVSDILVAYFPGVMDVSFTAQMEEDLDLVEDGKMEWIKVLQDFYGPFKEKLDFATTDIKKEVIYADETCPTCGKPMIIKWGRKGKFMSCSGYPGCKFAKSITSGVKCPQEGCSGELILRRSGKGKSFYGCSQYPQCRFTSRDLPKQEQPPSPPSEGQESGAS